MASIGEPGLCDDKKISGEAVVWIEFGRQRKIEPGMAELERFARTAIWKPFARGHGTPPSAAPPLAFGSSTAPITENTSSNFSVFVPK